MNLAANCIALWKMNDNEASATVLDAMGNHNGTFNDAGGDPNTDAHDAVGKINGALEFDGTDDYVEVANHADLNFGASEAFTICFWMKTAASQTSTYPGLVVKLAADASKGYRAFLFSDGGANDGKLKVEYRGVVNQENIISSNIVDDQSWHFVIYGRKVDGTVFLYIDGADYQTVSTVTDDLTNTEPFYIGVRRSATDPFEGTIDAVMIFDKALSEDEVAFLWNGGAGRETLKIVPIAIHHYKMAGAL